jgi:hypothetical protein
MQGHREAPQLWEKHANRILRQIGLTTMTHEPCLYSLIHNHRVLLLHQVDNFSVAAGSESIASAVFDLIDEQLSIPLKCMGLITLFNGVDVTQTCDYVKILCHTYLERICKKYICPTNLCHSHKQHRS